MIYRQGDVLLKKVLDIPKDAAKVTRREDIILAYGETTGHAHRIKDPDVKEFTTTDKRFLTVLGISASLTHEEHNTITLPKGIYEIVRQREYTPEDIRNVND